MRRNIKNMVEQLGHTVVGEAEDGNEAVYKYQECEPDVVTLDIVMPIVDGIEALKRLMNKDPEAKVVMVTSLGHKSKVLKAIELGASHYVVKPIKVEDISRVLNEILGEESKELKEPNGEENVDKEQETKEEDEAEDEMVAESDSEDDEDSDTADDESEEADSETDDESDRKSVV